MANTRNTEELKEEWLNTSWLKDRTEELPNKGRLVNHLSEEIEKSLANHLMGGKPHLGVRRTIMAKVNRSPRWAYAVGGDLLVELDRAAKLLGLDRPDTARQALQAGLALLLAGADNVPREESTTSGLTADEVRYPEGWTGKMLREQIDPAGIELVDGTYEEPVPNGPAAAPTSPAEELSSAPAPSASLEPDVELVARKMREQGFPEATVWYIGDGPTLAGAPVPDNPFDVEPDPRADAFWAAAERIRNELRQTG